MAFFCDIQYNFPNSNDYLNTTIQISNKDILYIYGNNGSGKTTLFNLINGFINPNKGTIKLNNKVIFSTEHKINIIPRKRNITRVFQSYNLFPNMNVQQNLSFANKNPDFLNYLVDKLDLSLLLKKNIAKLSGGQKQKVSIVQSLINNPELLLLDESFANIDLKTTDIIKDILRTINIPILITTHNKENIKNFATASLNIKNGKVERH